MKFIRVLFISQQTAFLMMPLLKRVKDTEHEPQKGSYRVISFTSNISNTLSISGIVLDFPPTHFISIGESTLRLIVHHIC